MREDVATMVTVFLRVLGVRLASSVVKAFDHRDREGTAKSAKKIFLNKHKRRRFLGGAIHFKSSILA